MTIPMIKVPTFTMTLPFSKDEVKFRPYVVREEKLLIMAAESQEQSTIVNQVGDIVKECTFGKIDIASAPMFDVQHAFLQIRGKSVGETFELYLICGSCEHKTPTNIHSDSFVLQTTEGHTNKLALADGFTVVMRYPTISHYGSLFGSTDDSDVFDVIAECVESIYTQDEMFTNTGDNKKDIVAFLGDLTPEQFEIIESFFLTMPVLKTSIEFTCTGCGKENVVHVDGINNFFH